MQITVTGRGLELTQPLKDYATTKGKKVQEFFDNIQKVEFILEVKDLADVLKRHIVEIKMWAAGHKFIQAIAHGKDMYIAVDKAVDEAKKQIEKHKEKLVFEQRREAGKAKHDYSQMEPNV